MNLHVFTKIDIVSIKYYLSVMCAGRIFTNGER